MIVYVVQIVVFSKELDIISFEPKDVNIYQMPLTKYSHLYMNKLYGKHRMTMV